MMSRTKLNRVLIAITLILVGCCMVLGYPTSNEDLEQIQAADYDYDTDDQSNSPQNKLSGTSFSLGSNPGLRKVSTANSSTTLIGVLGENIVLKCNAEFEKSSVILWYQGDKMISNGNNVVLSNFSLDPNTFDLTILKASSQSAGDYFCQVMPQRVSQRTEVIVMEHPLEAIAPPESSTSGQSSLHHFTALMCLIAGGLVLQQ